MWNDMKCGISPSYSSFLFITEASLTELVDFKKLIMWLFFRLWPVLHPYKRPPFILSEDTVISTTIHFKCLTKLSLV